MWAWMYATRIPAMQKAEIDVEEISRTGAPWCCPLKSPALLITITTCMNNPLCSTRWLSSVAMLGAVDTAQVWLAWAYVGARVVHSLIQATKNIILVRFGVFAVGSVVLFVLLVRTIYLAVG